MGYLEKFQTIRSSRLAGYREHIYECLVLLYIMCICFINFKIYVQFPIHFRSL